MVGLTNSTVDWGGRAGVVLVIVIVLGLLLGAIMFSEPKR